MRNLRFFSLFFLLCFILFSCKRYPPEQINIVHNWQFRQAGNSEWFPATVPGCVHTDLLNNSIIDDPYFGDNEQKLQWIGNKDWEYKTTFRFENPILRNELAELVFEGLDTYANVYLNDSLILKADNMFREWTVNIRDILQPGENSLFIKFISPLYMDSVKASQLTYKLPDERGFSRKAPYQYGWDWGPKFVTSGIWRPVFFRVWDRVRISDVHVSTAAIQINEATTIIEAEIESAMEQTARISYQIDEVEFTENVTLVKGSNIFNKKINLPNPRVWWPNGMGEHPLYNLKFQVQSRNSRDEKVLRFGIRQVELIQEKDSIGQSFYFKINGLPFFAKGANYIPQDNFSSRVTDEKYRQTIQDAVDANMNMLRVWGGGIYEKDIFYDLCDEKGILIWQDFMFAGNMYPGDSGFLDNVKQEATYQAKRLRNHPCLALWCGNNEVDEGWKNWGWQKGLNYSYSDSSEVWRNYLNVFEEILPQAVLTYSPYIPYIPSSPRIGWGHKEALTEGDMHYWGVWWGEEPFDIYEKKVGRFMSEYGFQGFPDIRTLNSCLLHVDKNLQSIAFLNHQKHPRGMQLIQSYMESEFDIPVNFEDYAYVSQLVQAYGIKKAIEAHRRTMPQCMGTLYWQMNDCWPAISWSSVDYYNRWKALHYFVKEAYKDLLISFELENDIVKLFVISDKFIETQAKLELKIIDFNGNIVWENSEEIKISPISSKVFANIDVKKISKTDHLITSKLIHNDSTVASNCFYFLPPKELQLPIAKIKKEIIPFDGGYIIHLKSDKLSKNVFLYCDIEGFLSDNYFDLKPGELKIVKFITQLKVQDFEKTLKITSLVDTKQFKSSFK